MKTLRLILGDQLNLQHSWFRNVDNSVVYVMFELKQESLYVTHHIQKIAAFFAAMERFVVTLRSAGHHVEYHYIDAPDNSGSLSTELSKLIAQLGIERFEYQLPDEYRLDRELAEFCAGLGLPFEACDTEHFLCKREALSEHFAGKKTYLMESFYRMMRRKTGILMHGEEPIGEKWNFDHDNRSKLPSKFSLPQMPQIENSIPDVLMRIGNANLPSIGTINGNTISWPLNRMQSLEILKHFATQLLPHFGTYQDAMTEKDAFLFHSRLSFALNTKMLHPLEVIETCIEAWKRNPERIALNQLEGFVRQILGWREYMRGIYWAQMPGYAQLNFFEANRKLPEWFWTGETKMNCLKHAIGQSLEHAYAHHIQRLMVTGNFMLLAGINPDEADRWYLGIYIDAIEWVEITNTRGMSQFADGGIVGSKPYCSSAAYIQKMSDYCGNCAYDAKTKTEANSCPFNALYWHFHVRNRAKLERNPRIGMMYKTWDKMQLDVQNAVLKKGEGLLERLEVL
ncbi:MAG: cryptochrome/photolyase family protein [Bacteroidia bacterium]|jgi:deoxyribodipyrimidine photolyase-related protein